MNHRYGNQLLLFPSRDPKSPSLPQDWPTALWEVPREGPRTSAKPFCRKPGVQSCLKAMVMGTCPAHASGGGNRRPRGHI